LSDLAVESSEAISPMRSVTSRSVTAVCRSTIFHRARRGRPRLRPRPFRRSALGPRKCATSPWSI